MGANIDSPTATPSLDEAQKVGYLITPTTATGNPAIEIDDTANDEPAITITNGIASAGAADLFHIEQECAGFGMNCLSITNDDESNGNCLKIENNGTDSYAILIEQNNDTDAVKIGNYGKGRALYVETGGNVMEGVYFSCNNVGFPGVLIEQQSSSNKAALEIKSTKGALLLPRMTSVQRAASAATAGSMVFDTDLQQICIYVTGKWQKVTQTDV